MAKKKKGKPTQQRPHAEKPRVMFEIEDDADDMFKAYLDFAFKPDKSREPEPKPVKATPRQNQGPEQISLDLHGKTLVEASAAVDELMIRLSKGTGDDVILTVITGKGLHSAGHEAVLWREIPVYMRHKWLHLITFLDEFPEKQKLGNFPFKGHFRVKVRRQRRR